MTKYLYLLFSILVCVPVHAEKADSLQELKIRSESQTYDGNKKITVYTGKVHMVKGTMVINADRLVVIQDENDGKIGTLYSDPGNLVTYRQKRDGGPDLWAEGEADKVVYDDTQEVIKLFNKGHLILLDGKKRTQEASGIYISYDSRTDFMQVHNTLEGVSVPGAGFTNAVIYPTDDQTKTDNKSKPVKTDAKPDSKAAGSKANDKSTDKSAVTPVKPVTSPTPATGAGNE